MVGSKRYERIDFLGEGTFATVYKAKDLNDNGRIVAIKKIKLGNRTEARDGLNRTALRKVSSNEFSNFWRMNEFLTKFKRNKAHARITSRECYRTY